MADNVPRVGEIIQAGEAAFRDAIHVAVAPVTAAEDLEPGQRVGLLSRGAASALAPEPVGIVDPFLRGKVLQGERFYLFLFPGTITGLRHQWTHKAFRPGPFKEKRDD
jgi:hypothetical protein